MASSVLNKLYGVVDTDVKNSVRLPLDENTGSYQTFWKRGELGSRFGHTTIRHFAMAGDGTATTSL
jgi:hypothetical protein